MCAHAHTHTLVHWPWVRLGDTAETCWTEGSLCSCSVVLTLCLFVCTQWVSGCPGGGQRATVCQSVSPLNQFTVGHQQSQESRGHKRKTVYCLDPWREFFPLLTVRWEPVTLFRRPSRFLTRLRLKDEERLIPDLPPSGWLVSWLVSWLNNLACTQSQVCSRPGVCVALLYTICLLINCTLCFSFVFLKSFSGQKAKSFEIDQHQSDL